MGRKIPTTSPEATSPEANAAFAAEAERLRTMNSLQWLTLQAELAIERGLDLVMGPATEEALRPPVNERKRKKRRRQAPQRVHDESAAAAEDAPQVANDGRRIPSEWEKQAAAKRRALQILEIQREEDEWLAHKAEAKAENLQNILQNTMVQLGGLYAVSQACLLSIFVPQKCPGYLGCIDTGDATGEGRIPEDCLWSPWFTYATDAPDGHLCSMKENIDWANFTQRNKNVFLINAITLCVMLMAQSYFWKREVWMIQHLSEDNSMAYNNLPSEVAAYTEFEDAVAGYNRGAFYFALAVGTCIVINFGMTTDFLIKGDEVYNYNLGSRTITGLLTNTMLVSTKVLGYLSYARLSYANAWAISMFSVVPLSYNTVDDTHKARQVKTLDPVVFDSV